MSAQFIITCFVSFAVICPLNLLSHVPRHSLCCVWSIHYNLLCVICCDMSAQFIITCLTSFSVICPLNLLSLVFRRLLQSHATHFLLHRWWISWFLWRSNNWNPIFSVLFPFRRVIFCDVQCTRLIVRHFRSVRRSVRRSVHPSVHSLTHWFIEFTPRTFYDTCWLLSAQIWPYLVVNTDIDIFTLDLNARGSH